MGLPGYLNPPTSLAEEQMAPESIGRGDETKDL